MKKLPSILTIGLLAAIPFAADGALTAYSLGTPGNVAAGASTNFVASGYIFNLARSTDATLQFRFYGAATSTDTNVMTFRFSGSADRADWATNFVLATSALNTTASTNKQVYTLKLTSAQCVPFLRLDLVSNATADCGISNVVVTCFTKDGL